MIRRKQPALFRSAAASRLKKEDEQEFARLVRGLYRLLMRVREYEPESNLYLEDGSAHLMVGPSHDEKCDKALMDNVAVSMQLPYSGGGGW